MIADVRLGTGPMSAILVPIALGILTFLASVAALWFVATFVLLPLSAAVVLWLPALLLIPSLVLAGFVAGLKSNTAYPSRKLVMGAIVGFLSVLAASLGARSSGAAWFAVLLALGGASVAAVGAYLSTMVSHAP